MNGIGPQGDGLAGPASHHAVWGKAHVEAQAGHLPHHIHIPHTAVLLLSFRPGLDSL